MKVRLKVWVVIALAAALVGPHSAFAAAPVARSERQSLSTTGNERVVADANAALDSTPTIAELLSALEDAGAEVVHVSAITSEDRADPSSSGRPDENSRAIAEEATASLDASPTPREVETALTYAGATDVHVLVMDGHPAKRSKRDVPQNAFTVSSLWADYVGNSGKKHLIFYGFWNFRNDYVNGSNPDDSTAIAVGGFDPDCWTQTYTDVVMKDYHGVEYGGSSLNSNSHLKSIFEIDDRTSGFRMLTDNGIHAIDYRRDHVDPAQCNARKAGSYFYEHNQDGDGGWTASVSLAALSISYSSGGETSRQKAATYNYYP